MPKSSLDAIDSRIVAELQAGGRLSNVELADKVGLSPSPCLRRVKRLEREGYIEGYRAALRRDRVGLGFSVFVGVKIDGHANNRALAFEKAVVAMPEVIACHLVSARPTIFSKSWCPISPIISDFWWKNCLTCRSCAKSAATLQYRR
jgi:Lrp/AsnC family leucine-responsive transcriptional regulator